MALNVMLNTRVSSTTLGTFNGNYSYYDPLTGTNLTKGNPVSGDLSAFAPAQMVNISNAIYYGTLSIVASASGSGVPASTAASALYSHYFYHGSASGSFVPNASGGEVGGVKLGQGITGVAAADLLQNNF